MSKTNQMLLTARIVVAPLAAFTDPDNSGRRTTAQMRKYILSYITGRMHNTNLTTFISAEYIAKNDARCRIKVLKVMQWLIDNDWLEEIGHKGRARILEATSKLKDACKSSFELYKPKELEESKPVNDAEAKEPTSSVDDDIDEWDF